MKAAITTTPATAVTIEYFAAAASPATPPPPPAPQVRSSAHATAVAAKIATIVTSTRTWSDCNMCEGDTATSIAQNGPAHCPGNWNSTQIVNSAAATATIRATIYTRA